MKDTDFSAFKVYVVPFFVLLTIILLVPLVLMPQLSRIRDKNLEIKQYYVSSFMAQQAVEKALKSFYIQEKKVLKKTHSISSLAKDLNLPTQLLIKISELEPIYQKTRYPDITNKIPAEEFEKSDVEEFINTAQEVIEWIEKKLSL